MGNFFFGGGGGEGEGGDSREIHCANFYKLKLSLRFLRHPSSFLLFEVVQ